MTDKDAWAQAEVAEQARGIQAALRLMKRVGLRREVYTVRESLHRSDGWLDGTGYALLAEECRGTTEQPT